MRAAVSRSADAVRRLFDLFSQKFRSPLLVVVVTMVPAIVVGALQGKSLQDDREQPPAVSLMRLEVAFDATRFATLLSGEGKTEDHGDVRAQVVRSFITWDELFPITYGVAFATLFCWIERWRRFNPDDTAAKEVPRSVQRDLLILAPLVAALLDMAVENVPLYFAGHAVLADAAGTSTFSTTALVAIGSIGAALKWTLLLLLTLGTLRELVAGPRGDVLWRIRFSAAALVLGAIPLLATAQGQDILQRLIEDAHPIVRIVSSVAGLTFAALALWYCSRKLVQLHFRNDEKLLDNQGWYAFYAEHLPRMAGVALMAFAGLAFAKEGLTTLWFVGLAAGGYLVALIADHFFTRALAALGNAVTFSRWASIPDFADRIGRAVIGIAIGAVMLWSHGHVELASLSAAAWLCLAAAWLLYLYVYFRRAVTALTGRDVKSSFMSLPADRISGQLKLGVVCAGVFSALMFLSFTFWPVPVGRLLSPVWVVALTAANAVFVGSVTVWIGGLYRIPVVRIAVAAAFLFSVWNDNHDVPRLAPLKERTTLAFDFQNWAQSLPQNSSGQTPVVLVGAAGGGLRAAYWTAMSLADMQDEIGDTFGAHLYAISGVSGGSLGGGLFIGLLRDTAEKPERSLHCTGAGKYVDCVHDFMKDDFLSPVLAKLVAPDFLQLFLPMPIAAFDRSRALEGSWEASYQSVADRATFSDGFLNLRSVRGKPAMPALFLNATSVETGRRSIASRVQPARPGQRTFLDADDTLDILKSDMSLAAAIHNSARFTYISPAGHLENYDGQEHGHVVDGGYFENSGLATLQEVHDTITSIAGLSVRPLVVYLCNDPKPCAADLDPPSDIVPSTQRMSCCRPCVPRSTHGKRVDRSRVRPCSTLSAKTNPGGRISSSSTSVALVAWIRTGRSTRGTSNVAIVPSRRRWDGYSREWRRSGWTGRCEGPSCRKWMRHAPRTIATKSNGCGKRCLRHDDRAQCAHEIPLDHRCACAVADARVLAARREI